MTGEELFKLRETRAEKAAAAQALQELADGENRDLNETETEEIEVLLTDGESLTAEIRSGEDENRRKRLATQQTAMAEPAARRTVAPQPNGEVITTGEVKVFPRRRVRGELRSFKGPNAEENAYKSGQWLKAQLFGDDSARLYCSGNVETRILQTGSNISAAYLIPPEFETAIITLRETYGVIRQWADVKSMTRDTLSVPKYETTPTASWLGETGSFTASDPTFSQVQLTAQLLGRLTRVSTQMMEDSAIDLADWLADDMAQAFALAEDDAGLNGDQTSSFGKVHGIAQQFDDNNSLTGAVDANSNAQTFAAVTVAGLTGMMAALPQYASFNAAFYCSRPFFSACLERLAHAAGGATVQTFGERLQQVFMGYPVRISQLLPTSTGNLDNIAMCLFGDLSRAVVLGDRRSITLQVLTELYAATGEIGIIASERVDIVAHGAGTTSTAGPIVALIGVT